MPCCQAGVLAALLSLYAVGERRTECCVGQKCKHVRNGLSGYKHMVPHAAWLDNVDVCGMISCSWKDRYACRGGLDRENRAV